MFSTCKMDVADFSVGPKEGDPVGFKLLWRILTSMGVARMILLDATFANIPVIIKLS